MNELRESLNVIRNFAHILQEHHSVLSSEEVAEAADAIEEQSELALEALDEAPAAAQEEPAGDGRRAYGLSPRELEVLSQVALGLPDKQIAAILGVGTVTVSKHVGAILQKMGAASRTEAGVRATRERLL